MSLLEILTLARAGATDAAWSRLEALGSSAGPDVLSLKGRLLKDRAAGLGGDARAALLRQAGDAYAAAAKGSRATYPLINAATLAFLGGAVSRAEALARQTLGLLDGGAHEPDTRYWLGATRAEALLLLGREAEARAALDAAVAETPRAWEDHAVTLRQFRLILAEQDRPVDWLEHLRPPPAVHFAGPIRIDPDDRVLACDLETALEAVRPGTATGALAAGFDIVAAEALVRAGAALHVILPSAAGRFVDASVRPYGSGWVTRFDRLIAAAASLELLQEPAGLSDAAAAVAETIALGATIREAALRGADALALRVARGPGERLGTVPGMRLLEMATATATAATSPPGRSLGLPAHPLALVGWTGTVRPDRSEVPVYAGPIGSFAAFPEAGEAAAAAFALLDKGADAVVLDFGAFVPDAVDPARIETLLAIAPRSYPVATRSAALALVAAGAAVQTALVGEVTGLDGSIDYFSLWRAR